ARGRLVRYLGQRGRRHAHELFEILDPAAQPVVRLPAPPTLGVERRRKCEASHVERERPAIERRQLREAWHRRAIEALADDLVEREDAALARAFRIGEVDRWRLQAPGGRTVSGPVLAVAGCAV